LRSNRRVTRLGILSDAPASEPARPPVAPGGQAGTLVLTPRVGDGIRRYFKEHAAPEGAAFRVGVRGGGCSGLSYVLEVDTDTRRDGDLVLDADGIEVRVDKKSLKVLEGSVLDFKFGLMDAGFRFENPRAVKACGCGESFSLA
jgi:iron-sulfur cluster assembly protein